MEMVCFGGRFHGLAVAATSNPPLDSARQELARNNLSLVEIALEFGFGSQANFTRVFRKATSLTPGQYRELCGGQGDGRS